MSIRSHPVNVEQLLTLARRAILLAMYHRSCSPSTTAAYACVRSVERGICLRPEFISTPTNLHLLAATRLCRTHAHIQYLQVTLFHIMRVANAYPHENSPVAKLALCTMLIAIIGMLYTAYLVLEPQDLQKLISYVCAQSTTHNTHTPHTHHTKLQTHSRTTARHFRTCF